MIALSHTSGGYGFDLARNAKGHLETDTSLRTTVLLLLLTEGRALDEDVPTGQARGGYWGNSYPDVQGWELGSRLHLLTRGKATSEQARLIEQEIRARLQCLIDDGIALSLDVDLALAADRWEASVGVRQDQDSIQWIKIWEASI